MKSTNIIHCFITLHLHCANKCFIPLLLYVLNEKPIGYSNLQPRVKITEHFANNEVLCKIIHACIQREKVFAIFNYQRGEQKLCWTSKSDTLVHMAKFPLLWCWHRFLWFHSKPSIKDLFEVAKQTSLFFLYSWRHAHYKYVTTAMECEKLRLIQCSIFVKIFQMKSKIFMSKR